MPIVAAYLNLDIEKAFEKAGYVLKDEYFENSPVPCGKYLIFDGYKITLRCHEDFLLINNFQACQKNSDYNPISILKVPSFLRSILKNTGIKEVHALIITDVLDRNLGIARKKFKKFLKSRASYTYLDITGREWLVFNV